MARVSEATARKRVAAIGFKAHTGWAAAVIVGETNEGVEILAKRRIAMLDGFDAAAVYHVSHERGLPAAEARPMIEAAFANAVARAKVGIADLSSAAERHAIDRVAILVGADKRLPDLEVVLRSHPLVHAAEGEMYRSVLARACEAMQLQVMRIPAIDLARRASAAAHLSEASLLTQLAAAGRASGKPWAAEQRECALAAWAVLATA